MNFKVGFLAMTAQNCGNTVRVMNLSAEHTLLEPAGFHLQQNTTIRCPATQKQIISAVINLEYFSMGFAVQNKSA